jgi:uncharacterized protein (DUF934 family)
MPLYREGAVEPVADNGPAPLPLVEWLKAPTQAVALANTDELDALQSHLGRLKLIALNFPKYTDGRAYSQARLLRERYRYGGELRATGQVLRDQFVFMLRAGFDAFEVKKESDAEAFALTAKRYTVFYQPTGDGRITALHQRMQLRHSESAG